MQPPTESRLQSVLKMRERTVLRVLGLGFLMVMLLLGVAGLIAARDSSAIRRDAGQLASEQLLMARLLHEVMAEQNALTQVLHRVADPSAAPPDRVAILAELEAADAAVHSLTQEAMAEGRDWGELHDEVERFTTQVRQFLDRKKQPPDLEETRSLFLRHTAVVQRVDGLLEESSERLSGANGLLESESRKLERESSLLLGACLLLALACAVGTIIFAARSIRHIEWQAEELNRVSWQMLQSQEVAARRFSHELHDELGQSLAAARASLSKLGVADLEPSRADCLHLIDGAISNVRELSQLLRPVILDDFGLEAGLGFLTDKFAQRTRLAVAFEADAPGRFHE
ncbi:MAG: hypothetical protein KDK99_15905 [Verrucomicrobiales bacterium]|nr:hypothetical protein [Verrucomicrobiales bacterium]